MLKPFLVALAGMACVACGDAARLPLAAGTGPAPQLPEPERRLIPTVHIAPARGWAPGTKPLAAPGLQVAAFATGLAHPRWLYVLPNGDVLVAESDTPANADAGMGVRAWIEGWVMRRAGSGTPSADRITLLRDVDGDGQVDTRTVFLGGLHSPIGMALVGGDFYVADTDAVLRFPYVEGDTKILASATRVTDLPAGPPNRHWTKDLIASADGTKLYVAVGSNSNVGENGVAAEAGRAAIWEVDARTGAHRIFASGLRNPVGLAWEPTTHALWTAVNERDELGSDLVPDYMTAVRDGGFYGWPYAYYGPAHVDTRVQPPRPDLVAAALVPDYALGAHTASLGLAWSAGAHLGSAYAEGMFVGQHGSWNRRPFSGYRVVFVPFASGKPSGVPVDVLSGFLTDAGEASGRPVGVAIDGHGALLVADDVGNTVWRVTAVPPR
jgi:glucose/arabinose dehydrogenase